MRIKINAGFGNGTKGEVVVDTRELPKEYQLCHGALAIHAEVLMDVPAPKTPTTPATLPTTTSKPKKETGGRF